MITFYQQHMNAETQQSNEAKLSAFMQKKKTTQATLLISLAIDKATHNIQATNMTEKLNQLKISQLKHSLKQQQEKVNNLTRLFKNNERKKFFWQL